MCCHFRVWPAWRWCSCGRSGQQGAPPGCSCQRRGRGWRSSQPPGWWSWRSGRRSSSAGTPHSGGWTSGLQRERSERKSPRDIPVSLCRVDRDWGLLVGILSELPDIYRYGFTFRISTSDITLTFILFRKTSWDLEMINLKWDEDFLFIYSSLIVWMINCCIFPSH